MLSTHVFRHANKIASRSFSVADSFKASDLIIWEREEKKEKPGPDHVYQFGHIMTDHILECDWDSKTGWDKPIIKPYEKF